MKWISRDFRFAASHQLEGLGPDHKCSRLHGHTYEVRLRVDGETDTVGFIVDYAELDWLAAFLSENLDHRHLNDVVPFNPTAENLSEWLLARCLQWAANEARSRTIHQLSVGVSESPTTWAWSSSELST
jgi:6-pyruvoyltetrahydropterin/6-carboxytetrahydropterin synthase